MNDETDWTKTKWAWFLDKIVIAVIFVVLSAIVNYWTDVKKAEHTERIKTAENVTEKTKELWESVGKYRASLEKINRLKRERDIKLGLKLTFDRNADIESEIKKSKQLENDIDDKINSLRPYVGKPITEHVARYTQLLTMYHHQLDSLMFGRWPKGIDLSPQFKDLNETSDYLYQMEMTPEGLQQYVQQRYLR